MSDSSSGSSPVRNMPMNVKVLSKMRKDQLGVSEARFADESHTISKPRKEQLPRDRP